jgi:creatinine amidohydrolase
MTDAGPARPDARMLDGESATWPEAQARIASGCVAVLPFGAFEQHGPHLPLSTDTIMATGLARRVAEQLDSLLLPPVHYGETWNNAGFPGTVSLSFDTVRSLALDICRSLQAQGLRGLVVVNGDYGNQAPLRLAAREAMERLEFPVLVVDYPGMVEIAAAVCESEPAGRGFYHADEFETSLVLALRPQAVQMERAIAEYPQFPPLYGAAPIGLRDVSTSGVFGDARPARPDKGEAMLVALTAAALDLVQTFLDSLPPQR